MSMNRSTRIKVFQRDNFTCQYCGRRAPHVALEVEHILPISRGGGDEKENLVTSCFDCNRGKGSKVITPHGWGNRESNETGATVTTAPPFTVEELAAAIKYHPGSVQRAIRQGRIRALPFGKSWRIPQAEVQRILNEGLPHSSDLV